MTLAEFIEAQRAKRAKRGLNPSVGDAAVYRLLDGVFAGRSARAGGRP